jgi:CNT family concentrative nucleoside transporter
LNVLVRPTVIVGLFIQQVIALFVLKTSAGYSIFKWIATAANDLINCGHAGAAFFFDEDTVNNKGWGFVSVLPCIVFFVALIQMLHYVRASFDHGRPVIDVAIVDWRDAMAY